MLLDSPRIRRRTLAALAVAVVLAVLAAATSAPAGSAAPRATASMGLAGVLDSDFGPETSRRGKAPAGSAGGFVYAPRTPAPGFVLDKGRFTAFDAPEARLETLPYDINDRGHIVGRYFDGASEQAFMRDRAGRFTTIRIPGAQSAWAVGINNRRQVVGIYSENTPLVKGPGAKTHGFLLDRGNVTRIDFPDAGMTGAFGINDQGQVVGAYLDPERQRDGQRLPLERGPVHPNRAPRGRDNHGLRHQQPRPDRRRLRRR